MMERKYDLTPDLVIVTGDLAFGNLGSGPYSISAQYEEVAQFLQEIRNAFRRPIPAERVFLVPGNHDVDRSEVLSSQTRYLDDLAAGESSVAARTINELIRDAGREWQALTKRLGPYKDFLLNHYPHLLQDEQRYCYVSSVELEGVRFGIAGINSAWSCGRDQEKGKIWSGWQWQLRTLRDKLDDAHIRLVLAHHPISWLVPNEDPALDPELQKEFDFFLHGHEHQSWVEEKPNHVRLAAGACYGETPRESGYHFLRLNFFEGQGEVWLRRFSDERTGWIPRAIPDRTNNDGLWVLQLNWLMRAPLPATPLVPNDPSGEILPVGIFPAEAMTVGADETLSAVGRRIAISNFGSNFPEPAPARERPISDDPTESYLASVLQDALLAFSSQPRIWVEPVLSTRAETQKGNVVRTSVMDLIESANSYIVKAPPQYGLTGLAHHLVLQAWQAPSRRRWIYLDIRSLTDSRNTIEKLALDQLKRTAHTRADLAGVVIDAWQVSEKSNVRILKSICEVFADTPVIVMQTVDVRSLISPVDSVELGRNFQVLYLWSLSRERVRYLVSAYNQERHVGDEDSVTSRVVADIDALNIHRTPLNCLTVLKASEVDFSESPVNRTEVLGRVLFLLFNADPLPTYKLRPDMKDCEFVLGYFCEQLIRKDVYSFSREQFLGALSKFCKDRVMAMDVDMLFDILHNNYIVVALGSQFCFRFTYWIYYFAAQRMHHDHEFAAYILSEMKYARFPEIVEFYTGIDRRRENALVILAADLKREISVVKEKCGLPDDLNPYQLIEWKPTPARVEEMAKELREGLAASNLPDVIKDRYADRGYDRSRPYDQAVREVLRNDSLAALMLTMCAASRGLRNSDFVDPQRRIELLTEITNGWNQLLKVLWVVLPILADSHYAYFDGMIFYATSEFGDSPDERFRKILMSLPHNVVSWYQDDLFSPKMGPLILRQVEASPDKLTKHTLMLLLISKRPNYWRKQLEEYIASIDNNSFWLYDVNSHLRAVYQLGFLTPLDLRDLEYLIKMAAAKHVHRVKHPGKKVVGKVSNSILPTRSSQDS